jgi:hypothetical protein
VTISFVIMYDLWMVWTSGDELISMELSIVASFFNICLDFTYPATIELHECIYFP